MNKCLQPDSVNIPQKLSVQPLIKRGVALLARFYHDCDLTNTQFEGSLVELGGLDASQKTI